MATERRIALATVVEQLEDRLNAALLQLDTAPMYAALDSQLRGLLAEVTAITEVIGNGDADTIVAAGDEGRATWLAMPDLVNRYQWLRTHPELEPWVPNARQRDRRKLDAAEREHQLATARAAGLEAV